MSTDEKYRNLARDIKWWVSHTKGWFKVNDIDSFYELRDRRRKKNRWEILNRMVEAKEIQKHPKNDGWFRLIQQTATPLKWQDADPKNTVKVIWPFHLEEMVNIYPKSIVLIAGSFDAGKSAFMFNVIHDNQHFHEIDYFSSEMGPEELHVRLSKFPIPISDWNFRAFERQSDFADIIKPTGITIIDYLEIGENFFAVADELRAIFDKLTTGVAIIALQKKRGAELGRGAEFSAEKPRLYLSIDPGILKIVKAKNWVDATHNPNGREFFFKLLNGYEFIPQQGVF